MASNAERVSRAWWLHEFSDWHRELKLQIQYVNFKRYDAIKIFNFEIIYKPTVFHMPAEDIIIYWILIHIQQ